MAKKPKRDPRYLQYWAQAWRFTITFICSIALVVLALNQVGSLGFRYGKAAAYKEGAYACSQRPIRAQNEDVTWVISGYSLSVTPTLHTNTEIL